MNVISVLTILVMWGVLLPYAGSFLLRNVYFRGVYKLTPTDFLLISFGLGQILLIKVLTLIAIFDGLHQHSMSLILFALLMLMIVIDYFRKDYLFLERYQSYILWLQEKLSVSIDKTWLLVGVIVLFLFLVDLNPVRHADALRYHIEYSNYIFSSGTLPFVPHNQLALAADAELLFSLVHYWFGDQYVKIVLFSNFLFTLVVLYQLYGLYGEKIRVYGMLVTVLSPILFLASTIVKPDVIQLYYFSFSLLVLVRFNFLNLSLFYLLIVSLFIGEMVALKWTGILPLSVLVIFMLAAYIWQIYKDGTFYQKVIRVFVFLAVGVLLMPLYFYVRNYLNTGNPIWPLLSNVILTNDGSLLYEVSTKPSSRSGVIAEYGFLGYLFYTFFFYKPSVLGGIGLSNYILLPLSYMRSLPGNVKFLYVFLLLYIVMWFFASFRHLIWMLPVISILGAYAYIKLNDKKTRIHELALYGVYLLMLVQLFFIVVYSWFYLMHLTGFVDESSYYDTTPHYQIFNEVVSDIDDPSLTVLAILPSSELYYLKQPHIDGNISHSAIIDYKGYGDASSLHQSLVNKGIKYILYDKSVLSPPFYDHLKDIISGSMDVRSYSGKVITNRLLGTTRDEVLFLVKI